MRLLLGQQGSREIADTIGQVWRASEFFNLAYNGAADNSGVREPPDFANLFRSRDAEADRYGQIGHRAHAFYESCGITGQLVSRACYARTRNSVDEPARLLCNLCQSIV